MNSKRTLKSVGIALLITAAVTTIGFAPEEETLLADLTSNAYTDTPIVATGLSEISQPRPLVTPDTWAAGANTVESNYGLSVGAVPVGDSEISQPRPLVTPDMWAAGANTVESGYGLSVGAVPVGDSEISQPQPLVTPDMWAAGVHTVESPAGQAVAPKTDRPGEIAGPVCLPFIEAGRFRPACKGLAAGLYLQPSGLLRLHLREGDAQHAVLVSRLGVVCIDCVGEPQRPGVSSRPTLPYEIPAVSILTLYLGPALDCQETVLHGDVYILRLDPGDRGADDDLIALIDHVQRHRPVPDRSLYLSASARSVYRGIQPEEISERVPSLQNHL